MEPDIQKEISNSTDKWKDAHIAECLAIMEKWDIQISELFSDEKDKIEQDHETIG